MSEQPEYHAWRKHFISCRGRPPTAYEAWVAATRAQPQADAAEPVDSARYRLLRRGQHWSVVDGIGDALRAEALDAAIDAAIAAQAPGARGQA